MHQTRYAAAAVYCIALVAFSVVAALQQNAEFLFYAAVMVVLAGVVLAIDLRIRLSTVSLVGLVGWGLLHLAGGNLPVGGDILYNWRPIEWFVKYDQFVHFVGFGIATLVAWECLSAAIITRTGKAPGATMGLVAGAVLISMGLGAMNEVIEFIAHLTLPETNVGGYENTGWDLVSNLAGSVAMGAWIRLRGGQAPDGATDAEAGR